MFGLLQQASPVLLGRRMILMNDFKAGPDSLRAAEQHAAQCLSISHPQMSDADVNKAIDSINAFK